MASPSRSRSRSPRARRAAAAGPLARARARPLSAPPRRPPPGPRPPPLPRPRPRRGGSDGRRPGPEGALEGDGSGAPPGPQREAPRAWLTWGGFRARRGWGWRGGAGVAVADSAQPLLDPGQGAGGRLVWRAPAPRRFAIALLRGAERAEPPRPPAQAPTRREPGPRPRGGYEACRRSAAAHPSWLRPSRIQRPSQPGTAFHVGGYRSREKAALTPRVAAPVSVPHSGRAVAAPYLTPGGQGPQWPPPARAVPAWATTGKVLEPSSVSPRTASAKQPQKLPVVQTHRFGCKNLESVGTLRRKSMVPGLQEC